MKIMSVVGIGGVMVENILEMSRHSEQVLDKGSSVPRERMGDTYAMPHP